MRRLAPTVVGAWNRFWFELVDGRPLGLTRIGVALASFVSWAGTAPLLRHYYSDAGEFPIAAARIWSAEWAGRFLMPDAMGSFAAAAGVFALWGVGWMALLVGWRTRAAAWLHWGAYLWFYFRNPTFSNGGDELLRLTALYLALAYTVIPPAQRALTLDRRTASGASAGFAGSTCNPAWTVRMIQVQLALVYAVAGFWKVVAQPWQDGTALVYALGNPSFSRFGMPDAPWLQALFVAATLAVAWWEFLFPLLVAGRRTRLPALAFGVALHLGILVFLYVGVFPFIMLACYPAFLTGSEVGALLGGGRRRPPHPSDETSTSAASAVVP